MKKLIYLLLAMPLLFASCSNDESVVCNETVQVSFSAALPTVMGTRAANGELTVNKVVCAVFANGVEVENLREVVDIVDENNIVFAPRLIKGRTYNVVFWAMKDANYNVEDLTAISRVTNSLTNEADYDAFTATESITVQNSETKAIILRRPLAQLNIGISAEDWDAAVSLGRTPNVTTISYNGNDTFNALTGEAVVTAQGTVTRTATAGGTIIVNGKNYKQLGMYYVLMAETEQRTIDINYSVADTEENPIRSGAEITFIPIQRNYKTNVVGGLLTGKITYNITIDDEFNTSQNNNELN